jgi:hypothetical protein
VRGLSDQGKLLATYLLTGPHSNSIGAYLLPDAYVADDLGWSPAVVSKAFKELAAHGFAKRFGDGRHVVVCNFLRWNPVENPNVGKGALKQLAQLPADLALQHVIDGLALYSQHFPNGLETVSERSRNMEPNRTDPEPEPEPSVCAAPSALAPAVVSLPTNRFQTTSEEVPITQQQIDDYAATYPAADVLQQFRQMRRWLLDNPNRRKTAAGMTKFINSWLSREQDKAHGNGKSQLSFAEQKFDRLSAGARRAASVDGEQREGVESGESALLRLAGTAAA